MNLSTESPRRLLCWLTKSADVAREASIGFSEGLAMLGDHSETVHEFWGSFLIIPDNDELPVVRFLPVWRLPEVARLN